MELELRVAVPEPTISNIRAFIARQSTLHDVVVAGLASRPERSVLSVVIQDEYTHDVVVRWDEGLYLVYDTS